MKTQDDKARYERIKTNRISALIKNQEEDYKLLEEYEQKLRFADDPKSIKRYQTDIDILRTRIKEQDSEIYNLQNWLNTETEAKLELEARVLDQGNQQKPENNSESYDKIAQQQQNDQQITFFQPFSGEAQPLLLFFTPNGIFCFPVTSTSVYFDQSHDQSLVRSLKTGSPEEQSQVVHLLSQKALSQFVIDELSILLQETKNNYLKSIIADVFAQHKVESSTTLLSNLIEDKDEDVRINGIIALSQLRSNVSRNFIIESLLEKDWDGETIQIVLEQADVTIVKLIIDRWSDLDDRQTARAARVLELAILQTYPIILSSLESASQITRITAWSIFDEIFDSATTKGLIKEETVLRFCRAELQNISFDKISWQLRYFAIHILAQLRTKDAAQILISALQHPDVNTRPFVAYWIRHAYRSYPQAISSLAAAFKIEKNKEVKRRMYYLLGRYRPETRFQKYYRLSSRTLFWTCFAVLLIVGQSGYI
jgi:HEAT repeat protein